MTLAETVKELRERLSDMRSYPPVETQYCAGMESALAALEADPDYTLRDRLKGLVEDYEAMQLNEFIHRERLIRRLRELLEGKP